MAACAPWSPRSTTLSANTTITWCTGRTVDVLTASKVFHVSPFLDVEGEYRFRFVRHAGRMQVSIGHDVDGERVLSTALWGDLQPLAGGNLVRAAPHCRRWP
jgi:DUF1365 family protein